VGRSSLFQGRKIVKNQVILSKNETDNQPERLGEVLPLLGLSLQRGEINRGENLRGYRV